MKKTSKSLLADFSSLSITKESQLKTIGGQEVKLCFPSYPDCTEGDEGCCDEDTSGCQGVSRVENRGGD